MVVTVAPSAWTASTVHDFTDSPSTCTVQAPHDDVSQPTLVPGAAPTASRQEVDEQRAGARPRPRAATPLTVTERCASRATSVLFDRIEEPEKLRPRPALIGPTLSRQWSNVLHNIGQNLENGRFSRDAMLSVRTTEAPSDVLDAIEGWRAEGHRVALATVTKVMGRRRGRRGPRPSATTAAGSACPAAASRGRRRGGWVLAGEPACLVTFGITDEMVWDVGLACGGIIDVFVEPFPDHGDLAWEPVRDSGQG